MKIIEIRSQEEFKALPKAFDEPTWIDIYCDVEINQNICNGYYRLRNSSHAVLWDSSHAVLWDSSRAVLRGSSHAVLWGSSHAVLGGSSHAVLGGSSHAVLWEDCSAKCHSEHSVISEIAHNSTLICIGCKPKILKKQKTATIIYKDIFKHTKKSFLDIYPAVDGYVTLYKVTDDNGFDHHTGKIKY